MTTTLGNMYNETSLCTILNENSERINQPQLKIQLKQHQLALIKKCRELEDSSTKELIIDNINIKTKIGIIGDVVGSGKTLSILGLIQEQKKITTSIPKYFSNPFISYINSSNSTYSNYNNKKFHENTNVIIVPHNIYKQWSSTIETYTSLTFLGIYNKKSYEKFIEILSNESFQYFDVDIILISSTKYRDICNHLTNHAFSRVIIDEADTIKITGFLIKYNFIWLVTSTYDILCNPNGKIYYSNSNGQVSQYYSFHQGYTNRIQYKGVSCSLMKQTIVYLNNIGDSIRKYLIIKNDDEFIKKAFELKDYVVNILKSNNPLIANVLGSFASDEIMNHINGGDIEGAIEKLNCKKVSEKFLIEAVTKDIEEKIHNKKIELEMKSKMTYSSESAKKESLDKIKKKINEFEQKIDGIKNKLNDNNICSICYDSIENKAITMCCNTSFCIECISSWLYQKNSCPFCRAKISNDNICVITDKELKPKKEIEQLPSKMEHLKQLINSKNDNDNFKMLIFSDFQNTFNEIIDFMETYTITYKRVIGTTSTINKIIENYKKPNSEQDSIKVLLLNAEYCASGINLENTSDIVIFHSMSKAKTKQIIGRGQRPGRKSILNVWKLCYENEIN